MSALELDHNSLEMAAVECGMMYTLGAVCTIIRTKDPPRMLVTLGISRNE